MFTQKSEIEAWLKEMKIQNYVILPDLSVDVNDGVDLSRSFLKEIPVQFNHVKYSFDCSFNELNSLSGSPGIVGKSFDCDHNNLTSLKYSPKIVNEKFWCQGNSLISLSLQDLPVNIGGWFVFNQDKRLPELESLYSEKSKIYCEFAELKKTLNSYELYHQMSHNLPIHENNKKIKI